MKRADIRFTYRDYLQLSDEKRYEIIEGELYVVPGPNFYHQEVSGNLWYAIFVHVRSRNLGKVIYAPFDVVLSEENVVQPDILFVAREHLGIIEKTHVRRAPDLVVEILSEATKTRDLEIKRKLYAKFGVREYWIVDPEAQSIEVLSWTETGFVTAGVYPHTARLRSPLLADLDLPLKDVFSPPKATALHGSKI